MSGCNHTSRPMLYALVVSVFLMLIIHVNGCDNYGRRMERKIDTLRPCVTKE